MLTMNFIPIAIISLLLNIVYALEIGDNCVDLKGRSGDCQRLSECNPIVSSFKFSIEKLKFCDQDKYIVCCPKYFEVSVEKTGIKEFLNREERTQISVEKCFEYERRHDLNNCNEDNKNITNLAHYPHMALIGNLYENSTIQWRCGGILLSSTFVLVNNNCLQSNPNYVRLGLPQAFQQKQEIDQQQNFIIKNQIELVHPYFNNFNESNGIALIELNIPAKLNRYIIPVCLPYSNTSQFDKGTAIGWSYLNAYPSVPLTAKTLELERLNDNECQMMEDLSDENLRFVASQFCVGSTTATSTDSCQNVLDGALFTKHPDPNFSCSLLLVGITSFTETCGIGNRPTLYTKIRPFVNSIEKIVWNATAATF